MLSQSASAVAISAEPEVSLGSLVALTEMLSRAPFEAHISPVSKNHQRKQKQDEATSIDPQEQSNNCARRDNARDTARINGGDAPIHSIRKKGVQS